MGPEIVQQMQAQAANAQPGPANSINEAIAKVYDSLADQTPIFNATGDVATYTVVPAMFTSDDVPEQIIPPTVMMVKVDGKW